MLVEKSQKKNPKPLLFDIALFSVYLLIFESEIPEFCFSVSSVGEFCVEVSVLRASL